jgi:mgtE-like transporter
VCPDKNIRGLPVVPVSFNRILTDGNGMDVRAEAATIYRETLPVLVVSLGGGLFAGLVLEGLLESVAEFPGLLVMVPVFLATRGNVYGALGGRIASGLHQGLIEPQLQYDRRLANAALASLINGIGISVVIGALTWLVLTVLPNWEPAMLVQLVAIMFVAGVLTSLLMIVGMLVLIFAGFKYGYDPDNLVGPIVTTLGDIFGMVFLVFSVWLVGVVF